MRKVVAAVVLGCAVVGVGCTKWEDPTPPERAGESPVTDPTTTTVPTTEQVLEPVEDFGLTYVNDGDVWDGFLVAMSAPEISLFHNEGGYGRAVVRFPGELGDPACIASAELVVHLVITKPVVGVTAFPGDPGVLDDAVDGERIRTSHVLLSDSIFGGVVIEDQTGRADVTDLVRTWAGEGSFNSRWPDPTPAIPLALVLTPAGRNAPELLGVKMTEAGPELAPLLRIQRTC